LPLSALSPPQSPTLRFGCDVNAVTSHYAKAAGLDDEKKTDEAK